MKKISKSRIFNLFRSYYKSIMKNTVRFWLTIIGITVGSVLIFVSCILIRTYENSYYDDYSDFAENIIYIRNNNGIENSDIKFIEGKLSEDVISYYTTSFYYVDGNDNYINKYMVKGVSQNFLNNYLIDSNFPSQIEAPIVYKSNLLKGNLWNKSDVDSKAKKILINYYGARLLFNDQNPVGKYIEIKNQYYQITGIIENSKSVNNQIKYYNQVLKNKQLTKNEQIEFYPYVEIYMPLTTYVEEFGNKPKICEIMIQLIDEKDCNQILTNLNNYFINDEEVILLNKSNIIKNIDESIANLKIIMTVFIIFFVIISSFSIINTLFYSIKEKISEIGIRKAMGASNSNIIVQVIFEGLIYMILGNILALCISLILVIVLFIVINLNGLAQISLSINVLDILIILLVLLCESVIASIIPGYYASKLKIVDAVKFE